MGEVVVLSPHSALQDNGEPSQAGCPPIHDAKDTGFIIEYRSEASNS